MLDVREDSEATRMPRSCKKLIRFTPAELERVNERARALGQPVACYIREASLGARRKATPTPLSGPIICELARAATRLGSLRDAANARALPEASDFGAAVEELLDLIRRID
jgi:hypothetical protein